MHPNRQHLIYALGCNVIVEEIVKEGYGPQHILSGHSDKVTCVAVSNSGKYLASGQATHMGFKVSLTLLSVLSLWGFFSCVCVCELVFLISFLFKLKGTTYEH